jgi:hypothetical protein
LFDRGQAISETLRQDFGQAVLRDADRFPYVPQGVFGHDLVLGLAKNDPDARLVVRVSQQVVDGRQVVDISSLLQSWSRGQAVLTGVARNLLGSSA